MFPFFLLAQHFATFLKERTKDPKIASKELGSCIKGFGYFAGPCSAYYDAVQLNDYFQRFVDFGVRHLLEYATDFIPWNYDHLFTHS